MNQEMHTWIATVLSVLTTLCILHWHKFNKTDNVGKVIIFILYFFPAIISLGALFLYYDLTTQIF